MNLPLWNRWVTTIDAHDVKAVGRLQREHPDWVMRPSANGNPLIRVLAQDDSAAPVRDALLDALVNGLAAGALKDRPEPLWMTADSGWTYGLERLLPLCDPNAVHNGSTPLARAAMWGSTEAVERLLPASDPNVPGEAGLTALMMAAKSDHVESLRLLLADPRVIVDQVDHEGRTALLWTAAENQTQAATLLIKHGANPNVQDHQGWDALMQAVARGHGLMTTRLMLHHRRQTEQGQRGLDFQHRSQDGRLAEDLVASLSPACSPMFRTTLTQQLRQARIAQENDVLRAALARHDEAPSNGSDRPLGARASRAGRARL